MDSFDVSDFIGKFVEEARDRLKALTGALLRLEQAPDTADAIGEVLRQAHSLKGSASMLGLNDISQIAHRLEDLFVVAKRDPAVLDARAFDLVFSALDVLSLRVEQLARGMSEPVDAAPFCQELAELVGLPPEPTRGTLAIAVRVGLLIAYASLTGRELSPDLAQEVLRNVLDQNEKAVTIDIIQKFVSDYYQLKLVDLKSRNNSKSVAMPTQIDSYLHKALTHARGTPTGAGPAGPAGEAGARGSSPRGGGMGLSELRQSLRVPVEKLDGLANLAAEMVIQSLKASERHAELHRLELALRHLKERVRDVRLAPEGAGNGLGGRLDEHADALEKLSRRMRHFVGQFDDDRVRLSLITGELRQHVIELTMLPLSTVFDAFPRAVRDLARTFHEQVDLTITGRETELDKKIIEQIEEPLIHLLRNAIDHGIEPPDERVRKGKPPAGQLVISAEQRGNRILVSMRDDGRGIDPAELRAAAQRQGVAPEAELERWSDAELLELIFQPGFSTRPSVTDVSGRGVGMDVVRDVVMRLGGAIRVQSEPDRGTTIVLDLPLSLALLRVVLVEVGGETFAVPTAAVRRILYVRPNEIIQLQQGPVVEVAGETVSLVVLGALLQLSATAPSSPRWPVLVTSAADSQFGLIVDAIYEEQELVFKELRGRLRDQRTFAGASILGSGDIVPILDVEALFDLAAQRPAVQPPVVTERRAPRRPGRVLVVEDSLVAGELQKSILLAAGYEAAIAADGVQALDMLLQTPWDLVIADVDMPHMDGFELTARLRADARLRDMPVIIVTARDSADDRRRGVEAGADAFIVKREFDQLLLLDTVQRLIGREAESIVRSPAPPTAGRNEHAR